MKRVLFGRIIFLCLCIFLFTQSPCLALSSAKKSVKEANSLYRKGRLDEALAKYNDANVSLPDSDIVHFNMGAALYKKEDYQKAIEAFAKALTSEDKKIEADALYNLGNCKYKLGRLKENTDLSEAVSLLRESLDYYKRAVEIDQKNTDGRFNHEFVERELKILLDKLKQQEQQRQAGSSGSEGKTKEEKGQSGQAEEKDKQQEKEDRAASQQEEREPEEAWGAKEETQQLKQQDKELSEEGAAAILERGREERRPDYENRRTTTYDARVSKDW